MAKASNVSRSLNLGAVDAPAVVVVTADANLTTNESSTQTEEKEEEAAAPEARAVGKDDEPQPGRFLKDGLLSLGLVLLCLLSFTFYGALETEDGRTFYPWTWVPDLGLPEPLVAFGTSRRPNVW